MCLVMASLTATMGYLSTPSAAMARRRITPVVVSSVPPITPPMTSVRLVWSVETRSAPSSAVRWGRLLSTDSMWS